MFMLMKNLLFRYISVLFVTLFTLSCQKDDTISPQTEIDFSQTHLQQKFVKANEIQDVMDFLRRSGPYDFKYAIQTGSLPEGLTRSGEPDLILSDLVTDQILAITNEANLTNYSFQLEIENAPVYESEISFFNLIVKETNTQEGYYAYIQEYRMDKYWYQGNGSGIDLTSYTGKMIFYNLEGIYIAKLSYSNGQITEEDLRSPCPPDPGGGGGNGSGGGSGGSGNGTGKGDGGSTGGSGGGTGGGFGGGGIQVILVPCTGGPGHYPGDSCDCSNLPHCDPPYIIIVWGDEINDINDLMRNPCDELPVQCHYPNGDPCPCNATNDGCLEENPNVGVNHTKPHPDCAILNQILEHQPTKSKIVDLQNDLNSPIEKGFNLYMNSNGDVLSTPIAPGEFDRFNYSTTSNIFGGTHLHHDGVFPMFSLPDVNALYSFWANFDNGTNDSSLMTHIMVSQFGVYAVKIADVGKLTNFYNLTTGSPDLLEWLNEQLAEKYLELENPETGELTGNSIAFEKALLELLVSGYDAGVSLYKAKSDLSGWDKKALNSSGTPVTTFSCD